MATTSPKTDVRRVRRWLSRVLFAAGGAAAATLFAWVVTTASASAAEDAEDAEDIVQLDVASAAVSDADTNGATTADDAGDDTDCPAKAAAERFRSAAGAKLVEAREHAHDFWRHRVVEPTGRALENVGRLLTAPQLPRDVESGIWPGLGQRGADAPGLLSLGELPALSGRQDAAGTELPPATEDDVVRPEPVAGKHESRPESTEDRPTGGVSPVTGSDDGVSDVDGPSDVQPPAEPQPEGQVLPSPLPSHTSTSSGLHLDSPLVAIPTGMTTAFTDAATGSVRSGVRAVSTHPGAQPGVTPD